MNLEQIGFYTLKDSRAINSSPTSDLQRCELILTDACNFKCPYCRGLRDDIKGTMPFEKAIKTIKLWTDFNLKNIRFSGGEPTIYPGIENLVEYAKARGVERIALSTNGSADFSFYLKLINKGVNDFSISLDACCSSYGEKMSGGVKGAWEHVIRNIKELSRIVYTTVGIVLTEDNFKDLEHIVAFADRLGVHDIRIIPSAQFNSFMHYAKYIEPSVLEKHPILKYRVNNVLDGRHVRGLKESDSNRCGLVIDDMAVAGDYHFPCIIYMREQGNPIGKVGVNMRAERVIWSLTHNTFIDPICQKNCLDVCVDYNNKMRDTNIYLKGTTLYDR